MNISKKIIDKQKSINVIRQKIRNEKYKRLRQMNKRNEKALKLKRKRKVIKIRRIKKAYLFRNRLVYIIKKEIKKGHHWAKEYYPTIYKTEFKKYRIADMTNNIRSRISHALKRNSKFASTKKLIGCSFIELKQYLENRFKPGMTWENYGKWHVDHIKPCASFDLSDPEHQQKCFHYTNLQPLWAEENMKKHAKLGFNF